MVRDENGQMDVTDIKINSRVPSKELTERLGIDDIISVLQQNRLRQYMHLLQKQDNDWVKNCMEYVVEGFRPKKTGKRLCKKTVKHVN